MNGTSVLSVTSVFRFVDRFRMRPKMMFLGGLVLLGLVFSTLAGFFVINSVKIGGERYSEIQKHREDLENYALLTSDLNRVRAELMVLIGERDRTRIDQINDFIEGLIVDVENKFIKAEERADTAEKKRTVTDARETWDAFMNTMSGEMVPAIMAGKADEARQLAAGIQRSRYEQFIQKMHDLVGTTKKQLKEHEAESESYVRRMLVLSAAVSILLVLVVFGVTYCISRSTTERIVALNSLTGSLAEGDLTCVGEGCRDGGRDEIGELVKSTDTMAAGLKGMIEKVQVAVNDLSSVLEQLTIHYGDMVQGAEDQRRLVDETGRLICESDTSVSLVLDGARNLSAAAGQTSAAAVEMSASVRQVADSADAFSAAATDVSSSMTEMTMSIGGIAESIEHLSASFDETSSSLTEINATVKEIEKNARESVSLADDVTRMARQSGMDAVAASISGMEEIKETVGAMSTVINTLGDRSVAIGNIVDVIDEIAGKTNLLALNAAIIAASTGGEGAKAFAVVADEIKSLANQTARSTKEIAALIEAVQNETKSGVVMTADALGKAERGVSLAGDVRSALGSIIDRAVSSSDKAQYIEKATIEEAIAIRQITEAVTTMNEQIESISRAVREQRASSDLVMTAVGRIKDMSGQVRTATKDQASGSRQISEAMQNVASQAGRILDATAKQREISGDVVQQMALIRDIAEKSAEIALGMNEIILQLGENACVLSGETRQFKL